MKRRLLQSLRDFRPGSGGVLVLAFLLLPYLVDVAYYGDFTATHYAQESLTDGEEDLSADGQASRVVADDQAHAGEASLTLQDAGTPGNGQARAVVSPYYVLVASLTSRPPPVL